MKKTFTIFFPITIGILLTAGVFAQVPEKMSYQAIVRNSSDALVINTQVGMQISILQGSATGKVVYIETQAPTTNVNGLISIEIGGGTILSGDFTTIDWANGPYFIKTETDLTGGNSYTVSGTSQLLSVPFALHSKTAETVTGSIFEIDPAFTSSDAANITTADITNLSNLSGTNTGDQDISGIASNIQAIQDTATQIRADIPDVSRFLTDETDPNVPSGTQPGEMQYWNGTEWITVAPGNTGQILTFINGVPTWGPQLGTNDVRNPTTGKIWMDRNLGASQVATSSTDAAAYGDLYQWGRATDGHEKRSSDVTSALSEGDTPGHEYFITVTTSPGDWRSSQNDNLWQGVNGTNNPCPGGYRLPTYVEWEAERLSWGSNDAAGAFASLLKLPLAGYRETFGPIASIGTMGIYYSSTLYEIYAGGLYFTSNGVNFTGGYRSSGNTVRCIKD